MKNNFIKALKWYVIALFVIGGIAALLIAEERDSVRPLMGAVLSLGMAYILAMFWHKLGKELLLMSVLTFLATAFLTRYAPDAFYVLTGEIATWGFYRLWAVVTFLVGLPVMMWAFSKYD